VAEGSRLGQQGLTDFARSLGYLERPAMQTPFWQLETSMNFVMRESFNDSVENMWATISDFGGLGRYFSPVVKCRVEGSGVGCHRVVTLRAPDGGEAIVMERLEELDERAMRLAYSIPDATGFPIRDGYVGTMQLKRLGDRACELEWSARVEAPEGTTQEQTLDFMRIVYTTGFEGLKELHGG
jgi:Polyketide cyclase / dehydrase and lipid transport